MLVPRGRPVPDVETGARLYCNSHARSCIHRHPSTPAQICSAYAVSAVVYADHLCPSVMEKGESGSSETDDDPAPVVAPVPVALGTVLTFLLFLVHTHTFPHATLTANHTDNLKRTENHRERYGHTSFLHSHSPQPWKRRVQQVSGVHVWNVCVCALCLLLCWSIESF